MKHIPVDILNLLFDFLKFEFDRKSKQNLHVVRKENNTDSIVFNIQTEFEKAFRFVFTHSRIYKTLIFKYRNEKKRTNLCFHFLKKYHEYNHELIDYGYEKCGGFPFLYDALCSGCSLPFASTGYGKKYNGDELYLYKTKYDKNVESDIETMIQHFPTEILGFRKGQLRCRTGIHPLVIAFYGTQIPIEILEKLLHLDQKYFHFKHLYLPFYVNYQETKILGKRDFDLNIGPSRKEKIKSLLLEKFSIIVISNCVEDI